MRLVLLSAVAASLAGAVSAADNAANPPFPTQAGDAATLAWLKRNTTMGESRYVLFGPDVVVVVLTDQVDPRSPWLHRVSFRREAIKPEFVARTGGRSLRAAGELDCSRGSFKVEVTELYAGADLKGALVSRVEPGTLTRPQPGSSFADMFAKVCAGGASSIVTPPPAVAKAPATTAPRPAPALQSPPRPTPPSARPSVGTDLVVQIGAFGSRALADGAWRRLSGLFPAEFAGKTMQMRPVPSNGGTLYRTWVSGFADAASARAACTKLAARGEPCLVRRAP